MKKYFAFFISCIAAVALASCQKEAEAPAEVKTHTVKFVAEPLTKTTMDDSGDKAVFSWTDSDLNRVHVFENGLPALSIVAEYVDGLMVITAEFSKTSATSFTYTGFIAPYTSSVSNSYPSLISSSKNQGTLAGAYDGTYDMLIARAESPAGATGEIAELTFAYKRVVAIHKMTLKGLIPGAAVSQIIISADTPIIGYYDMDKDEWVKNTNSITVDCIEEVDAEGNLEVGYVSAPFENANVTVKVVYENGDTYKKVFAKALTVAESHVSYYNVSGFTCSDYVRLPWGIDGTQGKEGWDADGLSYSELGDYSSTHSPYTTRLAGSDYIQIRYDSDASTMDFAIKTFNSSVVVGVSGSVDGKEFTEIVRKTTGTSQTAYKYTDIEIPVTYRYVRIINISGATSGFGVGPVSIKKASTAPTILAENVSVTAVGGTDLTTTYMVRNFEDDVVATCDGTIVTSASASNGTVTYSVAPNYTTTAKEGKITLTSAANPTAVKEITVTVAKSSMRMSVLTVTIPATATSATVTITTPDFGWNSAVTAAEGMNISLSPAYGNASADAQTITISSTSEASEESSLDLGTIKFYRNGNESDTQAKTVYIKKAQSNPGGPSESYTCGFEASEGFTAGTDYQNTVTSGATGKQWKTYYGTPSTSSCISGSQSMALRLYSGTKYAYTQMEFDVPKVVSVSYKAKAATTKSAKILLNTFYSIDGGSTWVAVDTDKAIGTSASTYTMTVNQDTAEAVRIKFAISSNSTRPSSSSAQLTIDDVVIMGY